MIRNSNPVVRIIRARFAAIAVVLTITLLNSAHADPYGERAALARLAHEIALLDAVVSEAESQADGSGRVRFQYDWLRQDLARIRLGIQEHINAPPPAPRSVKPLRGDYRR